MAKIKITEIKEKLLTRNQLNEILEKDESIQEFINNNILSNMEKPIIYDNFFDEGKRQTVYYCHNCGHSWTVPEEKKYNRYVYSYSPKIPDSETCPHCKNVAAVYNTNSKILSRGRVAFIREFNAECGYALIDCFEINIHHDNADVESKIYDGKNVDYLIGKFKSSFIRASESVFSIQYGIRPSTELDSYSSYDKGLLSPTSTNFLSFCQKIIHSEYIKNDCYEELFKYLLKKYPEKDSLTDMMNAVDLELLAEKEKKPVKKTTEDEILSIELTPVDSELALESLKNFTHIKGDILSIMLSSLGGQCKFVNLCSCGEIFETTTNRETSNNFTCPKCGNTKNIYRSSQTSKATSSYKLFRYENVPDSGMIVIRIFNMKLTFDIEKNISYELSESTRIFYSEKSIKVANYYNEKWNKGRVTDIDNLSYNSSSLISMTSKKELIEIIKSSDFKYSGLIEAMGLDNDIYKINDISDFARSSYIYQWTKHKILEQIVKTGLKKLVIELLHSPDNISFLNEKGTTIYEILDISKPVFRIIKERNANLNEIKTIKRMWNLEQSMTTREYEEIIDIGRTDLIIQLKEKFSIPFKKSVEYINSCYNNQCIEKYEAMNIWFDYLKMAKDMEYKLKDNTIKYPASLKKDHDRAIFAYKVVQDEMNKKHFIENAEKNAKLYNYSYGDFIIMVPMSPNEVVQEGTVQKHCVASYVSRIRDGNTAVCFARRKSDPDTAYFTIEVNEGIVRQVRGYCNCAPKDEDFLLFLRKWAEKKSLTLRY